MSKPSEVRTPPILFCVLTGGPFLNLLEILVMQFNVSEILNCENRKEENVSIRVFKHLSSSKVLGFSIEAWIKEQIFQKAFAYE